MRGLIKYFIKYPVAGNVLLILILIFGYFGLKSLRKTFFPESESSTISIQVTYPGAAPSQIEEGIVLKIEDELDGLTGIDRIKSSSQENLGSIIVDVDPDYDTEIVLQDVKNAVDRINSFPDGMEPPVIYIREMSNLAISFALSGDVPLPQLKDIARKVETDLQTLDGISKVDLAGFSEEEIEIRVDNEELKKYGLTIDDVNSAIRRNNIELTGGVLKTPTERILIRSNNRNYEALELEDIIIKVYPNGQPIYLFQVAEVRDTWEDVPDQQYFQQEKAVIVSVSHTIYEDIVDISDKVKAYIETFNAENNTIKAHIINDRSKVLRERIDLLTNNGVIGFVLVLILLSLFLHPRLAAWVAIGIPVSFAGMFIASAFYGISINVISLFGMIIVIGILVDDGIIISENIYQHWEKGKNSIQAAVDATMEVLPAVFSAILTTAIAFSLFFLLDGRMGEFFPEMGFVVIATLLFSLVEGIFILPAHIAHSKALKRDETKKRGFFNKVSDKFAQFMEYTKQKFYKPILYFAVKNPLFIVIICICLFVITITGISSGIIKTTVFPNIEGDYLSVNLELPPGTSESETEKWLDYVEEKIILTGKEIDEEGKSEKALIEGIQKSLGPSTNKATLSIILIPGEERSVRSSEIINRIQDNVGSMPNVEKFTVRSMGPFGRAVSIALYSSNYTELMAAKTVLMEEFKKIGTLKNIESSDQQGFREVHLTLKEKAKKLGLTYAEVIQEVRKAFFGLEVQRLQRGIDQVKVWVRYNEDSRNSMGDLEEMNVSVRGKEYLLKDLVEMEIKRGIVSIDHIDGKRSVTVDADMLNPNKDSPNGVIFLAENEILPKIFQNYPSVKYSVEGQIREQEKTGKSASVAGPIVLILIIATVILTFRSFLQAATVFFMVPFGLVGVGWGHFIHDAQISMFSWFGMIALVGVMINDSLVFINALNMNLKEGMLFKDALIQAGLSRYRPILLTSVTTIAGLAPLIFETSFQAQFLVPMAIAIAYGLILATFLTLVFLPSVLQIVNWLRRIVYWLIHNKEASREEVEPAVKELKFEKLEIK